ncbi:MAG: peptidase S41 [Bacteroidetes bacterium HGW-Bacteroidetes-6]|jgi:carboxyl-terminal processing protease|nr:MAG: peptidase S41 [Bacteroidetes bacterium HGW-Bacteroidetes-6]
MRLVFALMFVAFVSLVSAQHDPSKTDDKFRRALQIMRVSYVDSIDEEHLTEIAIVKMLEELDPHSVYMSAEDIKKANEPLEGNFEGVGIQFQIIRDTINVVDVIAGGPSETVGIHGGDKIVSIDAEQSTGKEIDNDFVIKHLRGTKGTQVVVGIFRKGEKDIIDFTITRDKIPIHSVDAAYMVTPEIGYIKVNRFAANTMDEFADAIKELRESNYKSLILDLRGNSGGYLRTSVDLADQFLPKDQLIVYTQGRSESRVDYNATSKGSFEKGKLVVLIDEGSASASEIVTGALQDCDRALVIGRRSYGKGLVQRPFSLPDGSAMRLTVARYYTPSGRCIQKPYDEGHESYYKDLSDRMEHGELVHPDSIKFPDSLRYKTIAGRVVYGGGGIMPDIFIPLDTNKYSDYYTKLIRKNVFSIFTQDYLQENRGKLMEQFSNIDKFRSSYKISDEFMKEFFNYVETDVAFEQAGYDQSKEIIQTILRAYLARSLYGPEAYYVIVGDIDTELQKAIESIQTHGIFEKYQIEK